MRAAILLSAGRSRRFAGGNKLLARVGGVPLVARAVAVARAAPVGRIIVVVGHDRARVMPLVRGPRVTVVVARDHRRGASASLRAGLAALRPVERMLFVFLADMPLVPVGLPARLARVMAPGIVAVRPRGRTGPGHPVLLRRPAPQVIEKLSGDRGLGALIAGRTRWIETIGRRPPDIDTRRDLSRWRQEGRAWGILPAGSHRSRR